MNFIRSFLSYFLSFVIFIASLFLFGLLLSREIITHDNLYNALEQSEILDGTIKNNTKIKSLNIPDELFDYVEINDIIYNYVTDKFLYEAKVVEDEPSIDLDELNERFSVGIEAYIDAKIDEYTGGIDSLLESAGFDLGIRDKINEYIENNTSIDLSNGKYITESDLDYIYEYADEAIADVRDSSYAFDVIAIVFNDTYLIVSLIAVILSFILIGLINFNIISSFIFSIVPSVLNAIIYFAIWSVSSNIEFEGSLTAKIINYMLNRVGVVSFKYFIIFVVITIVMVLFYFLIKNLNIFISHKRGVATLDTVFDDYDQVESSEESVVQGEKE